MRVELGKLEHVLENKQGVLRYDRNTKILYNEFWGLPDLPLLKALFEGMMAHAEKNLVIGSINDLLKAKGTFTGINSWLNSHFYPHMISRGAKYATMATSGDPFTRFALNALINLTGPKGMEHKLFNNLTDCENWLYDKMQLK